MVFVFVIRAVRPLRVRDVAYDREFVLEPHEPIYDPYLVALAIRARIPLLVAR